MAVAAGRHDDESDVDGIARDEVVVGGWVLEGLMLDSAEVGVEGFDVLVAGIVTELVWVGLSDVVETSSDSTGTSEHDVGLDESSPWSPSPISSGAGVTAGFVEIEEFSSSPPSSESSLGTAVGLAYGASVSSAGSGGAPTGKLDPAVMIELEVAASVHSPGGDTQIA